jgi:hypothetical protein
MKQNMGSTDSFVRVMIGIAFYANIFVLEPGAIGIIILFALGTICMVTAWIKYCSVLALFGLSTCSCASNECCAENSCQCSTH